jgi:hypothetical protein
MDSQIIELLTQMNLKIDQLQKDLSELKKPKRSSTSSDDSENWWSVEINFNNILIKFSKGNEFNEFKDYIKELGGTWFVSKKAWKFPIVSVDQVIESIRLKFPNKEFKDLRTEI